MNTFDPWLVLKRTLSDNVRLDHKLQISRKEFSNEKSKRKKNNFHFAFRRSALRTLLIVKVKYFMELRMCEYNDQFVSVTK